MKKTFPSTISFISDVLMKKPFPSTRVILKCNEKTTRRKLCKINELVCIIPFSIRLNIRTEADSVLLAENFGKNDNKEK